jgi:hypothetical protein
MKIKVHYDFTQQELAGEMDVIELQEGARLGELLRIIDTKIVNTGKDKNIDTTYKTTLTGGGLNGCVVFINGAAPGKLLEQELHDGDNIEFVYGFCGG